MQTSAICNQIKKFQTFFAFIQFHYFLYKSKQKIKFASTIVQSNFIISFATIFLYFLLLESLLKWKELVITDRMWIFMSRKFMITTAQLQIFVVDFSHFIKVCSIYLEFVGEVFISDNEISSACRLLSLRRSTRQCVLWILNHFLEHYMSKTSQTENKEKQSSVSVFLHSRKKNY